MTPQFHLPAREWQAAAGLVLALLVAGSWLGLHFYAMLQFELSWANLPLALVMAALQCWLSVGVFIISHDAMHGSLAPGHPRLNGAIGAVLLFLYAGFGWQRLRGAHFDHHRFVGTGQDPDFDEAHPRHFLPWYGTFLKRYFGWRSLIYVNCVVAIYWLIVGVPMAQIVLLYGLPAIASSMQLFYFGTYRPHRHEPGGEGDLFADGHNARSEGFGPLMSLATCYHFGYHLEHHRRPDVPWWALPAARKAGVGSIANATRVQQ